MIRLVVKPKRQAKSLARQLNARRRVAREAAFLLYTGVVEEYRQAKEMAARSLGVRVLPSNLEVALELDRIADEFEGERRRFRIVRMRREALELMELLKEFKPRLIGSVWRGTAIKGSDIAVEVYADNVEDVERRLRGKYTVFNVEDVVSNGGRMSHHIYLKLPSGDVAEIVVRGSDEANTTRICEIYGDRITGLNIGELRELLKVNPSKKFIPQGGV